MVGIGQGPHVAGPQRGDIHIAALPDVGGSVIRGPHPVVVVQTNRLQRSTTVVVVPLTSAARAAEFEPPFLVRVLARASGLPRDGWAKCDQPLTIPVELLGGRLGRLNPETMERMDGSLRFVLGL